MNILMVTHHYLYGNGGGVYASRAYINAFAEIADRMTLLYPMKEGMDIEGILDKVVAIPIYHKKHIYKKALDFLCGRVHRFFDSFEYYLGKSHYDYVVFDNSKVSYRLIDIAHNYRCKVITIHHNYEYEYNRDNLSGITKLLTLFWIKRLEKESIQKSDLNFTLTVQDRQLLADAYNAGNTRNIEVLGCFEYKRRAPIIVKNKDREYQFIITGSLGDVQTELSLLPWLEEYFPILKKYIPESKLVVAGRNPSIRVMEKCKELDVTLYASPTDMQPLLDAADFYICPTSLGGGLKLRVMDGLKNGLPVIAHEISARGYDSFIENGCLLTYRDRRSFEECLKHIQCEKYNRHKIQTLYNTIFTFDAGVLRLKELLYNQFI